MKGAEPSSRRQSEPSHDQQEAFRDENAAIMSQLRVDGNKLHLHPPEEEATEQQSIVSSSRRISAASSSATSSDQSLMRMFQRREMMMQNAVNDDSRTRSVANTLFTETVEQEQQLQDSQQVTFDENETNQSQHRLSVSEENPFATADPQSTSPIDDDIETERSSSLLSLALFRRRRRAKIRSSNTPQSEMPGAVRADNSTDIPPERSNDNNSNHSNRATSTFQQDEPLDPLMDDQVFSHGSSELFASSSFASSQSSQNDEDVSLDLTPVEEESSPFGINGVAQIEAEINKRKKKKIHRIVSVVVIVLGLSVGVSLGLLAIPDPSREAPTLAINTCEIDYSAICKQQDQEGMEMGTFIVPECARTTYQTLIHEFFFNSSSSSSSRSAAITNATNNTDIDTRIFQPCEPSFLALLSLAVTTTRTARTTQTNEQVEKYKQDYYALATFYFSTGGPTWNRKNNWLDDLDVCVWFGVTCSLEDSKKAVTEIKLNGNNLVGSLPSEIALIMNLTSLILVDNLMLTGIIPTEIGNCRSLRFLTLRSTTDMFSGSIPSELGQLHDSLDTLELESLSLTGTIPAELGKLNKLTHLALAVDGVSGTIPSELANLASLETLFVGGAQLRVTEFSSHLLSLTKLKSLIFFRSIFATTLLSIISQFGSLENLGLIKNSFHGTLPTELGLLTNLTELRLNEQDFIGQLPTELGKLTKLKKLDLEGNKNIIGDIPSELGLLSNLSEFILAGNSFSGTLPSELCFLRRNNNIVFQFDDISLGAEPFIVDNCQN